MNCLVFSMLVSLTITGTVTSVGAASSDSCVDGWIQFESKCYFFSTNSDEENIRTIRKTCESMDSTFGFPTNEKEWNFLSSYIQRLDVYGWMTGYSKQRSISLYGEEQYYFDNGKRRRLSADEVQPPEIYQNPESNWKCVAYRPNYFWGYSGMTTVDCHIKLPYVCRGDPSKVSPTGKAHWLWKNGTQDIFWISDSMHKLNFSAAKTSCESKSMALLSIRSQQILEFLEENLIDRSANKLEPWWTGLQNAGAQTFTWTDNVPMDESVITWLPPQGESSYQQIVLLGSGKALSVPYYTDQLSPFICMKNSTTEFKYNCPIGWIRGGGSCYKQRQTESETWDDAGQFCAHSGSHLLTIDSQDELTWLRVSKLMSFAYYDGTWVSLNNKKSNNFIWSDGSKLDRSVVDWMKPLEDSPSLTTTGHCVEVLGSGELILISCSDTGYYGCQYPTSNGKCYTNSWSYFQGYCYLTEFQYGLYRMRFNNAKTICKTLVAGSDINPDIVKIETKELFDFLLKAYNGNYFRIGLNRLVKPGQWSWADGTKADLSVFPNITEPDNGPGKNCVAVTPNGNLYTNQCNERKLFICEKEIKITKTPAAQGSDPGQAAHFKPSHWMVFIVITVLLKICYLIQ